MNKDMQTSYTATTEAEAEPITIESLWKLYIDAKIVPMTFKPTGETVYVTAQMRDWIERSKEQLQKEGE